MEGRVRRRDVSSVAGRGVRRRVSVPASAAAARAVRVVVLSGTLVGRRGGHGRSRIGVHNARERSRDRGRRRPRRVWRGLRAVRDRCMRVVRRSVVRGRHGTMGTCMRNRRWRQGLWRREVVMIPVSSVRAFAMKDRRARGGTRMSRRINVHRVHRSILLVPGTCVIRARTTSSPMAWLGRGVWELLVERDRLVHGCAELRTRNVAWTKRGIFLLHVDDLQFPMSAKRSLSRTRHMNGRRGGGGSRSRDGLPIAFVEPVPVRARGGRVVLVGERRNDCSMSPAKRPVGEEGWRRDESCASPSAGSAAPARLTPSTPRPALSECG